MEFRTVAEAFNHYRSASIEEIERRAEEIKDTINTDASADVTTLNIELSGLAQVKENIKSKQGEGTRSVFNPITGANATFEHRASLEATEGDVFASTEYRSAFYKTLLGQKLTTTEDTAYRRAVDTMEAEKRAFNDSASIAAVLPSQTLNEIVKKARTMGGLLSVCRAFNLPVKLSVPVGTPSSRAKWHKEGEAVEGEKVEVVNVNFDAFEIIKIFSISAKVKRMSISAFESYLVDELYACVMATVEHALVNGSGTDEGTGIETIAWVMATNAVEYAALPVYGDFVKTMALLKRGYSAGAYWAMNNATLYTHVYGVVDDNKRPIFIADPKQEQIGHILGKPVVIDDNIAEGDIYLGNFQYLGYNFAEAPIIEVSRESSFKNGLIDYRALAIADTKPIVKEAFVKLHKTSGK